MTDRFVLAFVPGVTPAKWIGAWRERMPRTPIELLPVPQDEALQSLRDGTAAIAIVRLPVASDGFSVIPLYNEVPVVVAGKDHPIAAFESLTLAELADEQLVDGQDAAAVELVAATDCIAIMPHSIARLHARKDLVARPVTDAPETRVGLVWLEAQTTPWVEEFVGIVRGRTANSSRGKR